MVCIQGPSAYLCARVQGVDLVVLEHRPAPRPNSSLGTRKKGAVLGGHGAQEPSVNAS